MQKNTIKKGKRAVCPKKLQNTLDFCLKHAIKEDLCEIIKNTTQKTKQNFINKLFANALKKEKESRKNATTNSICKQLGIGSARAYNLEKKSIGGIIG